MPPPGGPPENAFFLLFFPFLSASGIASPIDAFFSPVESIMHMAWFRLSVRFLINHQSFGFDHLGVPSKVACEKRGSQPSREERKE